MDLLELFLHRRWQMSPGDRAALEGVVASLRPRLALEIGSAEGRSLERIAAHSEAVHSIDLQPPVVRPANATIHTGDSHELLRPLLERLDRGIDFAHVDGDHERWGAQDDLTTLLESPRTARTVILVHDSLHESVRTAIAAAARHPKVSYADLDFVPGRMIRGGPFADQLWGGFALLMVGIEPPVVEICETEIEWHDSYDAFMLAGARTRHRPLAARLRHLVRRPGQRSA